MGKWQGIGKALKLHRPVFSRHRTSSNVDEPSVKQETNRFSDWERDKYGEKY